VLVESLVVEREILALEVLQQLLALGHQCDDGAPATSPPRHSHSIGGWGGNAAVGMATRRLG